MDAVSALTLVDTFVPRSCRAFDSSSPVLVVVPSLSIAAVRLPTPRRSAGSNWSAPPRNVIVNDTSGRSSFSDTISSAPLPSGLRVHVGTRSTGCGPGAGTFVRSSVCWAVTGNEAAAASRTRAARSAGTLRMERIIGRPPEPPC